MTQAVIADTMVLGWIIGPQREVHREYQELVGNRQVFVPLQVLAEVRYGMLLRNWGEFRRKRFEQRMRDFVVIQPVDETSVVYARIKHRCQTSGHALAAKNHDGDRWIAATAVHVDLPLVTHDKIFRDIEGLNVESLLER